MKNGYKFPFWDDLGRPDNLSDRELNKLLWIDLGSEDQVIKPKEKMKTKKKKKGY